MPAPRMSSQLDSTSAILGEYMLKGWTLTDLHCDVCRITPLMREPAAVAQRDGRAAIQFCALCDGSPLPAPPSTSASASAPASALHSSRPFPPAGAGTAHHPHHHHLEGENHHSHSDNHGASAGPGRLVGGEAGETIHASSSTEPQDPAARISSLLLRGYSLLGTNCPTPTCRGIPLVGYPRKPDSSKDGRRMCVNCGGRWVEEGNLGRLKLVHPPRTTDLPDTHSHDSNTSKIGVKDNAAAESGESGDLLKQSPREKRRRELYGLDVDTPLPLSTKDKLDRKGKSKARVHDDPDLDLDLGLDVDIDMDESDGRGPVPPPKEAAQRGSRAVPPPALSSALLAAQSSLCLTLSRLASSLEQHHSSDEARYFVDVKLHTEAMRDVLDVLERMKRVVRHISMWWAHVEEAGSLKGAVGPEWVPRRQVPENARTDPLACDRQFARACSGRLVT